MISNTQTPIYNYKFRSIWRKCMKGKPETWVACQRFLRESLRPHIVDMNRGEGNSQAALRKERQTHVWRSETGRRTSSLALEEGCRSLVRKKSNSPEAWRAQSGPHLRAKNGQVALTLLHFMKVRCEASGWGALGRANCLFSFNQFKKV